jgi:hypothetical protein
MNPLLLKYSKKLLFRKSEILKIAFISGFLRSKNLTFNLVVKSAGVFLVSNSSG